jgi:hypothetical protein
MYPLFKRFYLLLSTLTGAGAVVLDETVVVVFVLAVCAWVLGAKTSKLKTNPQTVTHGCLFMFEI